MIARGERSALLLCIAVLTSRDAAAQPSPADAAAAEALFAQGVALLGEGKQAEACARLDESFRLEAKGATAARLAECLEAQGKLASAWLKLRTALQLARRAGLADREAQISARIAALEPRVPRLTIDVTRAVASVPGVRVARDGSELGAGALGVALPVDPGPVRVEATAPGRMPHVIELSLAEGEQRALSIDALGPAVTVQPNAQKADAAPAPPPRPAPAPAPTPLRWPGWALLAAGGAAAAVGAALVIDARIGAADAQTRCFPTCELGGGKAMYEDARKVHVGGLVSLIAGGALVAGGVGWLWLSAPDQRAVVAGVRWAR